MLNAGNISDEEFRDVLATFSQEVEPFLIRAIDDKIVADALTHVTKHGLKSADSIQLATVMELKGIMGGVGESVIFVCDDEELAKAGVEEDLEVINPRKGEDRLTLKEMLRRR